MTSLYSYPLQMLRPAPREDSGVPTVFDDTQKVQFMGERKKESDGMEKEIGGVSSVMLQQQAREEHRLAITGSEQRGDRP